MARDRPTVDPDLYLLRLSGAAIAPRVVPQVYNGFQLPEHGLSDDRCGAENAGNQQ